MLPLAAAVVNKGKAAVRLVLVGGKEWNLLPETAEELLATLLVEGPEELVRCLVHEIPKARELQDLVARAATEFPAAIAAGVSGTNGNLAPAEKRGGRRGR